MKPTAATLPIPSLIRCSLGGGLRLGVIAWHVVRGVYLVSVRFPGLAPELRQAHVQQWSSAVLQAFGVSVRVHGALNCRAQILVANHVSWLDVIVLLALCPHARFVSKAEVRRWPLIGRLAEGVQTIFVERDRPRQTIAAVDSIVVALSAGETVIVFPEGTTTDGHAVLPFRAPLLHAAWLASAPVQPLALRYADARHEVSPCVPYIDDDSLLGSLWRTASAPGLVATVMALPVHDLVSNDRRANAAALRAVIQAALEAPARQ